MGYIDLSVSGSDSAADDFWELQEVMAKTLTKNLKDKGNEYNTCGAINVAMIFDQHIIPKSRHAFRYLRLKIIQFRASKPSFDLRYELPKRNRAS